jgi:hypothetical protein
MYRDKVFRYRNHGAERIAGFSKDDVIGRVSAGAYVARSTGDPETRDFRLSGLIKRPT